MSDTRRIRGDGDEFPITGGGDAPDFLINEGLPELPADSNPLLADINVLIAQDPCRFNFRATDLGAMDEKAMRQFLADLQEALGIGPLTHLTS